MENIKSILNREKEQVMSKMDLTFLDVNDVFPELELRLVSGKTLSVPEGTGKGYGVLLLYRGYW